MKKLLLILSTSLLVGCASELEKLYTKTERNYLKENNFYEDIQTTCPNSDNVKSLISNEISPNYFLELCTIDNVNYVDVVNLIEEDVDLDEAIDLLELSYFDPNQIDEYKDYADTKNISLDEAALHIKMHLNKPFYSDNVVVDNFDKTKLINKYYALPDNYEPQNLVPTPSPCIKGKDYSCQSVAVQELNEEAALALQEFFELAKTQNIEFSVIASYRTIQYQKTLYDNAVKNRGQAYADKYYARPGQSEHNTGYAIDLAFKNDSFNKIENNKNYPWLLENIYDYGFILRYPKGKEHITGYGYESWHFRYVGKEIAKIIKDENLTLEEYYAIYGE